MAEKLIHIHGEPSYKLSSKYIEIYLTKRAGHMAPVRFKVGSRWVSPFSLSPWEPNDLEKSTIPLLSVLRGDFFCLPFGGMKGSEYVHGEPANKHWELINEEPDCLELNMKVQNPQCDILKKIYLKNRQRAVYQEHVISGLNGRFSYGHHAIIQFPDKGGPYYVNTSPFRYGRVKPSEFSNPINREYGALKTGARFNSLSKVSLARGGTTSLKEYPNRRGFDDLVLLASRKSNFAWTGATLDGYVWVSLKNPETLPCTLFWITNGGRHGAPWNGRHFNRLGLEEVNSHYSDGLEISRKDLLKEEGIPTTRSFSSKNPASIRIIQLVQKVPKNFGPIAKIKRDVKGMCIYICNAAGVEVEAPVDWKFL